MFKKLALCICFLLLPNLLLASETEEVTVLDIRGYGITQLEAVQNGLIEALKQTRGVNIESQRIFEQRLMETSVLSGEGSSREIQIDKASQSHVKEVTDGLIHEYRVIESQKNPDGGWEVLLAVKMVRYKTPGISPHSRRKIAVIPFGSTKAFYSMGETNVPAGEVSRQLAQKVVTELTQSRRFTVLDREHTDAFIREQSFILSGDTPVSEMIKLGEMLGVDYLLIGTIKDVMQKRVPYIIQVTGEKGYKNEASLFADYRIVVMATRQIKWADSVSVVLGDADFGKNAAPGKIRDILFENGAKQMVHRAMDNIYPLRVAKVQGNGEIIINQGGVSIVQGEKMDVFSAGESVIDTYTGETLGAAESWIAAIEIVRVNPKMSYAKVINGEAGAIVEGSICRRMVQQADSKMEQGRDANVIRSPSGGVYLPFD